MRAVIYLFFIVAAIVSATIPVEDNVLVLDESNFEEALAANNQLLVEFYAPWCGHCKTLAPEWAKAAKTLSDSSIKLAKVDATENDALAKRFEIKGFPTIKYLKGGKPSDYSGGRTANEIVNWANKKSGPAAVTVNSEDDLTKFQETHEVFALGVFESLESENAKHFLALADGDETHAYAITSAAAVKSKLAVTADTVVVLKNFDDLRADHAIGSTFTAADIAEFVQANSVPLVQTFSPESAKKIFGSPIQKHVLFFTDKDADNHAPTLASYTAAAAAFKGKLLFINVPSSENKILDYFGITAAQLPTTVLADLGNEGGIKKFPFAGPHDSAAITTFAQSFLNGELKPSLKSEEVSAEDTAGDVTILKGTSFNDLVMNNDKDVLVEFYAPWCGHCKKLAPIWDELGAHFKDNSNIVIAKMDSTANEIDVPGLAVKGFPTLYFFKGSDKANPIKYEEARELDALVSFVEKNAHHASHEEL